MSRILTDRQVILAKYGAVPTADNVITASEWSNLAVKVKTQEVKELGRGLGSTKTYPLSDWTNVEGSISAILKGGLPPKVAELYKMCGLTEEDETDDNGNITKVHFYPSEIPASDGYITLYQDDLKRDITGVVGDLKISFEIGMFVKADFDIKGFTDAEPVSETNPAVTLDDNEIFVVESISAVTIGGNSFEVKKVDFDMGSTINEIYAIGAKEYQITDYKPTLSITAFADKSNQGYWSDLKAGNVKVVAVTLTNNVGNKFTFTANACKLSDVSENDDNGNLDFTAQYICEKDSNNKNFEITYE
jgi:hypothetical protein